MGKSAGKIMPLPRGAYDENATYTTYISDKNKFETHKMICRAF